MYKQIVVYPYTEIAFRYKIEWYLEYHNTNESQNAAVSLVQQSEDLQTGSGREMEGSPSSLLLNDTTHSNSTAKPVSPISWIFQPYKQFSLPASLS